MMFKFYSISIVLATILMVTCVRNVNAQDANFFSSGETLSQDSRHSSANYNPNNMYYGGYLNMNFSKNYSVIGAQPLIGYKLTPELSLGTQLSFEYISDSRYYDKQNGSNYGASIFSRYRITPYFYAHTELALMSYKWFYTDGSDERKLAPMIYVGGGISQPISENTWLNAQVLFDVLNHENSPYEAWEPYYSIGFGVGF
nr:hypothetical protein [uncultured Draconibacterium sp.]